LNTIIVLHLTFNILVAQPSRVAYGANAGSNTVEYSSKYSRNNRVSRYAVLKLLVTHAWKHCTVLRLSVNLFILLHGVAKKDCEWLLLQ